MLQRFISRFSVENFLSHSAKTIRRGNFLCCVSESIWWRLSLWIRGSAKYQDFIRKFYVFISHSAEKFRSGTLLSCVSETLLWRKVFWISSGEYQDFPSKTFCLTVAKNFVGEPFCAVFQKMSSSEKVYG